MHGIPKILQTRADFDESLALARSGQAHADTVARHFAGLVESAHHYAFEKLLSEGQEPDGAMPEYCVLEPTEQNPARTQLKLSIDPQARLFALGYTVAEVESIITELGAL